MGWGGRARCMSVWGGDAVVVLLKVVSFLLFPFPFFPVFLNSIVSCHSLFHSSPLYIVTLSQISSRLSLSVFPPSSFSPSFCYLSRNRFAYALFCCPAERSKGTARLHWLLSVSLAQKEVEVNRGKTTKDAF